VKMPKTPHEKILEGDENPTWFDLPEESTVTDDWTVLVLDNGCRIVSFGRERLAGAEVHVVGPDDVELAMWEMTEWAEDPEFVMGAILRVAASPWNQPTF